MKVLKYIGLAIVALTLIIMIGTSLIFSGAMPQTAGEKAVREKFMAAQKAEQQKSEQQPPANP